MPGKKRLRGASSKEQRQYEQIKNQHKCLDVMASALKKWPLAL